MEKISSRLTCVIEQKGSTNKCHEKREKKKKLRSNCKINLTKKEPAYENTDRNKHFIENKIV